MAEGDEDISILTLHDNSDSNIDDSLLFENLAPIQRHSSTPNDKSESFLVLHDAYDKLKVRYNDLYLKSENQTKKIKEMESRQGCGPMSDSSTSGSYLYVSSDGNNQPSDNSTGNRGNYSNIDFNVLQGQVTELHRRVMTLENEKRSLNEENVALKTMVENLRRSDEDSRSNVIILEKRVEYLLERLRQLDSIKGSDLTNKIIDLEDQCKKLCAENENLKEELIHVVKENKTFKSKYIGVTECNMAASSGMTSSNTGALNGLTASNALLLGDSISSLSLASATPTAEELLKLKTLIKSLKGTIVRQHSALVKLQENPAIKKILQDNSNSMSMSTADLERRTNALISGSARMESRRNSLNNGIHRRMSDSISTADISDRSPRNSASALDMWPENQSPINPEAVTDSRVPRSPSSGSRYSPDRNRPQSRSEVIQGRPPMQVDVQRSHSMLSRKESDPFFQKESDSVQPGAHGYNSSSDYVAGFRGETSARQYNHSESEKICPVCSTDFTHITIDEFQSHVFNCVDEQPTTLTRNSVPDRVCPMCNHTFPSDCPQITVDNHVNAHFGEPAVGDGFEVLN